MQTKHYTNLAKIYDRVMRSAPYKNWSAFIEKIFDQHGIDKRSPILELACGTGAVLKLLSKKYEQITGLDLSMEMLGEAQKKTNAPLVRADMKAIPVQTGSFEAAYCNHNAINYLTSEQELKYHFQELHRILVRGGIYLFDVCTKKNALVNFHNVLFNETHGKIKLRWENEYSFNNNTLTSWFTFSDSRAKEEHTIYLHEEDLLKRIFKATGFHLICQTADYNNLKPVEEANLLVYVLKCS